jgi:AcrR family transcriptional regulator
MTTSVDRRSAGPHAETRQALLRAAGAVFAEHGFRDATVREICERAGANVASINYHFGDKERLYFEVLRHAMAETNSRHPFDGGLPAGTKAEIRLRAFVHSLLSRLFDNGEHAWLGRLMAKEMIDPSNALDVMVAERIGPMATQLRAIICDLLARDTDDETVWLAGFSIVSQCLFYNHCRSVVSRLRPRQPLDARAVERLTDHITRFSLAGLKTLPQPQSRQHFVKPGRARRQGPIRS